MRSVFNVPQPDFSLQEAVDMVHRHYGICCTAEHLYSERDQNFHITADDGNEYVLKVSNPAENQSVLQMQIDCTEHISDMDTDLNIPLTIKSISGDDIIILIKDGSTYYSRMVTFIPGIFLKDYAQSENTLFTLGAFMARLSRAMKGFEHPAASRKFAWNLSLDDFIQHFSPELKTDEERNKFYRWTLLGTTILKKSDVTNIHRFTEKYIVVVLQLSKKNLSKMSFQI